MKILIGVCGGIAAYKSAYLIRLFVKNGDDVKVIMTENSCNFITPLTMGGLSRNRVYTDMFQKAQEHDDAHIELSKWADVFVIAPATANTIAKIAVGLADNLLTSTVLAFPKEKDIFVVPAMNTNMFEKEITRKNLDTVSKYAIIMGPVQGVLASGDIGMGAMSEPGEIFSRVTGKN